MSTTDTPRWRILLALGTLLVVVFGVAMPADAQEGDDLDMTIRSARVLEGGVTRIVVDVEGQPPVGLDASAFNVEEAGEPVEDVTLALASDVADPEPRTVIISMDLSGSTAGPPLENALTAVASFATTVTERDVAVGLVSFSDQAQLVVEPTTDAAAITAALDGFEAAGETALYDGVVVAAQTLEDVSGQKSIVVFSDGADTVSTAELSGAINATTFVGAPVSSVALVTADFDPAALQSMADATGGRVLEVGSAEELQSAFEAVAQELSSQYVLEYPSTGLTGQFDIEVALAVGDQIASDSVGVLNTIEVRGAATPNVVAVGIPSRFGTRTALAIGLVALFIALALLVLAMLMPGSDRRVAKTLRAALGPKAQAGDREEVTAATAALSRRAIRLVESVPKPEGYDQRLQLALDRATWPIRSTEFTTLRALAVVGGLMIGWILLESPLVGLVLGVAGWFVPRLVLMQRVSARRKAFMEQLPDTLQLLSGSLKAGYGVLQGLDTIVKETQDPTKSEFQRVLTEARLGLPLEDSLNDMADRVDAEDFRWVAVAINIQRRVGGNLAALLETVADTLRERAATRRQISALSAEGRLSAIILVVLPFLLAGYMFLTQPGYIGELFFDPLGQVIVAIVSVLMVIGIFWMKNMIEIDV